MARRLGDLLVQTNRIDEQQLEDALREQRVSGGALGTHLVRIGALTEEELCSALAETYGVPAAPNEELATATRELLDMLSPEFARRHLALPFREDGHGLHVVFGDPSDLLAIQEAAFLAGRRIVAYTAPEFSIFEQLARVLGDTDEPSLKRPGDEETSPDAAAEEVAATPLSRLGTRLASATSRDAILDAMLETLAERVSRGALLALRAERAALWRTCGFPAPPQEVSIPLPNSGVLANLRAGEGASAGPLSPSEADAPLLQLFPDASLGRILVLPVYLKHHPVAVFLGDLSGASSPDLSEMNLISSLTATALEIVILRQKILHASGATETAAPGQAE